MVQGNPGHRATTLWCIDRRQEIDLVQMRDFKKGRQCVNQSDKRAPREALRASM